VGLGSLTRPDLIFTDLQAGDSAQVLRALAERISRGGTARDAEELFQQLWEREQLGSTGIGGGVAIPHCKLDSLAQGVVALGIVPAGVSFGAVDGRPVRLFLLVISPSGAPAEHLRVLAAVARWIKSGRHVDAVLALHEPEAVYDLLQQEEG
jgi:mannitol/fructose-specific phosphotransferase system IIA component (Ntr-type)